MRGIECQEPSERKAPERAEGEGLGINLARSNAVDHTLDEL